MTKMNSILALTKLHHDFFQVTIEAQPSFDPAPGQYVIVNNQYPLYVMGQSQQKIELLIPPFLASLVQGASTLSLSMCEGIALEKPQSQQFHLMIVEDDALSACLFYFKKYRATFNGFVLIGTKNSFPFSACPSRQIVRGVPPDVIAAIPLLEDWQIPHRLASLNELPGCYAGNVHELAALWLAQKEFPDITILTLKSILNA